MFGTKDGKKATLQAFVSGVKEDRAIFWVILFFVIIGAVYVVDRHSFYFPTALIYAAVWGLNYFLVFPLLLAIMLSCWVILRLEKRRKLAVRYILSSKNMGRFLAGTLLMFALLPFKSVFTNFKNAMSVGNGFTWDLRLADFDKALHFGVDPGPWLVAHMNWMWLLESVEFYYNTVWFVLCFSVLYWFAISRRPQEQRVRYVLCFILVWAIVGGLFAQGFISAGPAFYGHVTGDLARFGSQVAFVASSPNVEAGAFHYQDYLWTLHAAGQQGLATGISAFPSVHVGLVTMTMFFLFELGRKAGYIGLALTGVTMFGSVYLGWHYAIDGYFSIVLVAAIYFGVKAAFRYRWRWGFNALPTEADVHELDGAITVRERG